MAGAIIAEAHGIAEEAYPKYGKIARASVADSVFFVLMLYIFVSPDQVYNAIQGLVCLGGSECHASTCILIPFHCLFLYGSMADDGAGFTAAFLRHPVLVALGKYAFEAYLWHSPIATVGLIDHANFRTLADPAVDPPLTLGLFIALTFFFAALYGDLFQDPLIIGVQKLFTKSCGSCCDACGKALKWGSPAADDKAAGEKAA